MDTTGHRSPMSTTSSLSVAPDPLCAHITVPPGYTVEVVGTGLDGPEGLGIHDAGQIAVCEAIDSVPAPPLLGPGRLTLVHPSGRKRTLASDKGETLWIDVARDPSRGYFVTTLGGPETQPARGVRRVHPNGQVATFVPSSAHLTGIALDRQTGDLYVARAAPNPGSIDKVTPDGTLTAFMADVRPEGLAVTDDRTLIATIQRRPTTSAATAFNQVVAFNLETGAKTVLATNLGTLVGSLAVSDAGDIFVSDHKDGMIRRLKPDGTGAYTLSEFASGFSTSSRRYPPTHPPYFGLSFNHIAFDPPGRLYVSDFGAGMIYAITGPF